MKDTDKTTQIKKSNPFDGQSFLYRDVSEDKKNASNNGLGAATLHLAYTAPFNFSQSVEFMKRRAIKGVEVIDDEGYARTFRTNHAKGYFTVRDIANESALALRIVCDDIRCHMKIHHQVRRMFDLDTDFTPINEKFQRDTILSKGMVAGQVPRLPIAFDPFEFCVRAILGQQVSVQAAATLASRVAEKARLETEARFPSGLDYYFPGPQELVQTDLEGMGITRARQATIANMAQGLMDKVFSLNLNQSFETFQKNFSSIKGIGEWTVAYVAMRGMGMVDSFPATDLGIIKALEKNGKRPSRKEILKRADLWRPYRAYAALCLWNQ
ncbi:MAG: hypothetical protein CSA29_00935 [Desulfobacterales bacterium]|nr:MAG: hypothetical protein CSA29_00935 [Desulfobacterales bacterium]